MSNKIIFNSSEEQSNNNTNSSNESAPQNEQRRPNLFQGRPDGEANKSQFPDWDIIPPNQFINPRIKTQ